MSSCGCHYHGKTAGETEDNSDEHLPQPLSAGAAVLPVLFGPWMDKTQHRSFVPKIPFVGKFAYLTRFVIAPLFVLLVVFAVHYSGDCPFVYGYDKIETPKLNDTQIAENMITAPCSSSRVRSTTVA